MARSYQHLIQAQRYQIGTLHSTALASFTLAEVDEGNHSTVAREMYCNLSYDATKSLRHTARPSDIALPSACIHRSAWLRVSQSRTTCVQNKWGSEQIAVRSSVKGSYERIYQHITADRQRDAYASPALPRRSYRRTAVPAWIVESPLQRLHQACCKQVLLL